MGNDERAWWKITSKLEKDALLAAVNTLAGLAIFFFGLCLHAFSAHTTSKHVQQGNELTRGTGYDQGMMGGVNDSKAYIKEMGLGRTENGETVVTNTLLQGGIVAVFYLGTLVGCFLGASVSDRFGRIKAFAFGAVWGIIGAMLQCTAQNPSWMIVSRLINGIGTGVLNATVPVYGSELSDHQSRGRFIAIEFALNIFGVVVAYWLGFGLSFIDAGRSEFQWRFLVAFQNVMLLMLLTSCWFFPESPRWLCMMGRREEALYVLTRIRGAENRNAVEAELSEIEAVVELEQGAGKNTSYFHILLGIGWGELHIARRVQLVVWLQILQSWTGIAGVTMYGPSMSPMQMYRTGKGLRQGQLFSRLQALIRKRSSGFPV